MSITRDFKLSLVAGRSVPLVINANQYDDGEIWRFTLLDENGQKYSPSTGSIIGLKSDGHIIANAGTVSSTGLVIIAETEQMTASPGKNFYELLIDDDTHGTANFIVFVEPRPGAGGTPSDSDLAVFQEAIDAAAQIGDASELVDDVAVLKSRMDEFTTLTDGSTTGDAELADIRVGADGTTYPNAGDAVRGQISDLKNALDAIDYESLSFASANYFLTQSGRLTSSGADYEDNYYTRSNFIPVKSGDKFNYFLRSANNTPIIAFYTQEDSSSYQSASSVKANAADQTGEWTAPSDGFVKIVCINTRLSKAYFNLVNGVQDSIKQAQSDIAIIQSEDIAQNSKIADVTSVANLLENNVFGLKAFKEYSGYLKTNGKIAENSLYSTTGFIPVKNGQSFNYKIGHASDVLPVICFYTAKDEDTHDSTKKVLGIDGYVTGTFTATSDGYVRFTYYNAKADGYVVFTTDIPDNIRLYVDAKADINIVLMGDSIFGNDGEIADYLSEKYVSCSNCAFGGTRVTSRGGSDNFQYFDGVNIISALCSQDWTDQDAAAEALASSYTWLPGRLARLKAIDMSEIDLLVMDWGTNDYTGEKTIEEITAAYGSVIDMLQNTYPNLRILIATPIWRYWGTESDNENGDTKVYNVSTLKEIALAIESFMKDKRITVFNAYQNIPLSYKTASTYFDSGDKTHLNATGNKVYADYLSGMVRWMYGI